jgi:hypothetical protein
MIAAVIAQFKFAATYLVPGAWQAVIFFVSAALGGLTSFFHARIGAAMPPAGTEWPFVLNVLFWLLVLNAIAGLTYTIMKIFGRKPSLTEVLSGLVDGKTFKDYKEEQRLRCVGLEKQISDARHSFDERANTDLARTLETFKEVFTRGEQRDRDMIKISGTINRLQERTEAHVRKLDAYDGKFDAMLVKVTEAAARGVRQAQERS